MYSQNQTDIESILKMAVVSPYLESCRVRMDPLGMPGWCARGLDVLIPWSGSLITALKIHE